MNKNETPEKRSPDIDIPLCVDLDGTLIAADTLLESTLLAIKLKPWILLLAPLWILRGKLFFKAKIHKITYPNYDSLPYRQDVIAYLLAEKAKGRKVVLATASTQEVADEIQKRCDFIDLALGTKDGVNLRSKYKRDTLVKLYGEKGFDYFGDSSADIEVFKSARKAYVVYAPKKVRRKAESFGNVEKVFESRKTLLKLFIKQIRVYQWVKNILIFLPVLMAHKIPDSNLFFHLFLAFMAFSLTASSVYVLNDLLDLESDRSHPRKKNRPLASGELSLKIGMVSAPALLLLGFGLSIAFLPWAFTGVLALYYILTSAYSFLLKRLYIIDIITLSALYTIRLIAGAFAADVLASPWLLAFSMFLFLSLAIVKRYTELLVLIQENKTKTSGRGYFTSDAPLLSAMGISSGMLATVVFAMYVQGKEIMSLYHRPHFLYLAIPFLVYWIMRIWFKSHRGEMNDDPIVFAVKDPASYVVGFCIFILVLGATL